MDTEEGLFFIKFCLRNKAKKSFLKEKKREASQSYLLLHYCMYEEWQKRGSSGQQHDQHFTHIGEDTKNQKKKICATVQ